MSHPTDDNRVPGSGNASHNRPDSSEQEIQQILADYGPNGRAPGKQDGAGRTADLPPEAILFQTERIRVISSPPIPAMITVSPSPGPKASRPCPTGIPAPDRAAPKKGRWPC